MSNTYRYILLWVSVVALVASVILATTPAASRAQLTWQGSYLTTPPVVGAPRLLQGHGAAPEVLTPSSGIRLLWQFSLGLFLILLGFGFHALFLSSHDRAAAVRVRSVPSHRRVVTYYWYRMRV